MDYNVVKFIIKILANHPDNTIPKREVIKAAIRRTDLDPYGSTFRSTLLTMDEKGLIDVGLVNVTLGFIPKERRQ